MTTPPPCDTPGRRTLHRQATVGGPPWPIPVALLVAAAVSLVAGALALVAAAPDLARGTVYGPDQLAAAHLVGLGFLTVAIVGALLQLVPVILRTPLAPPARAAVAGAALVAGAWLLALGLRAGADPAIAGGGSLVIAGGAVVVADLAGALVRARRAGALGAPGLGLAASGAWFALVLVMGGLMAANRLDGFLPVDRLRMVAAHGAIAILGWVGGTILAIALRLAPMFALSHGYPRRPGEAAVVAWHAAVVPIALGFLLGLPWLAAAGGLVLVVACGLAGVFVAGVARHRRRRPEAPLVHLGLGVASAAAAAVLMLAAWRGVIDMPRAAVAATLLAMVGTGVGVTSGHLFKVLPMLVWTGRFAHLAGTPGAPRLSDLYPHRLAIAEQAAFAAGLVLLVGGVVAGSPSTARTGAVLLVVAAAAVAAAAVTCLTHRVRPAPAPAPAAARPTVP